MLHLAWLLSATPALACSCAEGLDELLPGDGATGVALDAAPFLRFSSRPGPIRLLDADTGEEVPVTVEETTEGTYTVVRLVPTAPLEPLHAYVIDGGADYGSVGLPATFTTGEAADADVPGAVRLGSVEEVRTSGNDNSCGDALYLITKPGGAPADAYYETQLGWVDDFTDAVSVASAARDLQVLGHAMCGSAVPELAHGDDVWLRVRAVDLSGNAGPWSDVTSVRSVGGGPLGGCATTGGAPVGSLGLAILGLLGGRVVRSRGRAG